MRSRSSVDRRFKAAVFIVIAVMFSAAAFISLSIKYALYQIILGCASVMLISALLLWPLYGTFYELRGSYLYCRSGPFVKKIRYDKISYLGYIDNMLSSMAMAPRRIEIRWIGLQRHGKRRTETTMISPENREIFLAYLKQRCHYLDKAS